MGMVVATAVLDGARLDSHEVFDLDPVSCWAAGAPGARVAEDPGWPLAATRMSKGDDRGSELLTGPTTASSQCQCALQHAAGSGCLQQPAAPIVWCGASLRESSERPHRA